MSRVYQMQKVVKETVTELAFCKNLDMCLKKIWKNKVEGETTYKDLGMQLLWCGWRGR